MTVLQAGVEISEGTWGLEVIEVTAGSAAAEAGIQEGDYLLSANGEPLRSSRDLLRVRRHCYVGCLLYTSILILARDKTSFHPIFQKIAAGPANWLALRLFAKAIM